MIDKTMDEVREVVRNIFLTGWKLEETRCCLRLHYMNLFNEDYPVTVEISKDNSNTFYVKVICDISNYIRGVTLLPVYEYDELVTCLTKVKDSVNADMVGDLESELSSVACNYLKGVLNYEV